MAQVVIIIGLPGSGKTTWAQTLTEYLIFDDFVRYFFDGTVQLALADATKKVCLIDPRLCLPDVFHRFMTAIKVYTTNIQLVLFHNLPELCQKNKPNMTTTIQEYTSRYLVKTYQDYPLIHRPVWSNHNLFSS